MTDLKDIRVVTEPSREYLNGRQEFDYRSRRENCIQWLLTFGKDPEKDHYPPFFHAAIQSVASR